MAASQDYVPVPGSERRPLPDARVVGSPDPTERIDVTVLVRRRPSSEGLTSTLAEMDARPPGERSYFSREELEAEHGADAEDLDKVKAFAYEHNLDVVQESSARRTIVISGTVAALSAAFGVQLADYEYSGGTYRGRIGSVHVPAELRDIVQDVLGLDDRPAARPHFRGRFAHWGPPDQSTAQPHAGGDIPHFPNEIAKLYDFPTGVDGTNQCIGIVELGGGFRPKDLKNYFAEIGVPKPKITAVSVGGGHNQPTGDPNGPDGEVLLDIEVAGAVAPGAKIVVYFARNTNQGFLDAVNAAIHDRVNKPSVISISWGGREAGPPAHMQAFEQAFQDAAALGVTVCCASGDDGSSDIRPPFNPPFNVPDGLAHVDHPASCPHALGCGGTKLVSSGSEIFSEVVWNDPGGGATGGGVSDVFGKPAYQDGIDIPSVNPGGHAARILPDVAGEAAPSTGYKVLVDGQQTVIGGTSAVAPLWAGLIALINEGLGHPVGFINPLLYKIAAEHRDAFHDITQGNNEKNAPGYKAGQGYDACTGLGSPNGNNLLKALKSVSAAVPSSPRAEIASA